MPVVKAPLLALSIAVAASLTAAPAFAQTPTTPTPVPPAPGKATYSLHGGLSTQKMRSFAPSQQVVVRGRVLGRGSQDR